MIGGLTRNEHRETESGITFLMDIPVLGNLFKYTKKTVAKSDLVIFVTPRIVHNYIGKFPLSEPAKVKAVHAESVKSTVPEAASQQSVTTAVAPGLPEEAAAVAGENSPEDSLSAEDGWEE